MASILRGIAFRVHLLLKRFDGHLVRHVRHKARELAAGHAMLRLYVSNDVHIEGIEGLTNGQRVSLHSWSLVSVFGALPIGNEGSVCHGCSILTSEHGFDDPHLPIKSQPSKHFPVVMGNVALNGSNVITLAGITIGDGSVVVAGEAATRSFEGGHVVIGGVPARDSKTSENDCQQATWNLNRRLRDHGNSQFCKPESPCYRRSGIHRVSYM